MSREQVLPFHPWTVFTVRSHDRGFNDISEFAYVAGPIGVLERENGAGRELEQGKLFVSHALRQKCCASGAISSRRSEREGTRMGNALKR